MSSARSNGDVVWPAKRGMRGRDQTVAGPIVRKLPSTKRHSIASPYPKCGTVRNSDSADTVGNGGAGSSTRKAGVRSRPIAILHANVERLGEIALGHARI